MSVYYLTAYSLLAGDCSRPHEQIRIRIKMFDRESPPDGRPASIYANVSLLSVNLD